ncbi:MAG TPA: hypothetical protein VE869_13905 [Gemmatimonas sp.]|nr:hypothetical protein [Gemmatimonas sp.]
MRVTPRSALSLSAALLVLAACSSVSDGPSAVDARRDGASIAVGDRNEVYNLVAGKVNVCAFFPYLGTPEDFSGRQGTFSASAKAGENVIAGNFIIQPLPSCIEVWNSNDAESVPVSSSLVASHPGYELERIVVASGDGVVDPAYQNIFGTTTATVNASNTLGGYIWFKFKKVELPPRGGQGCTPGYWKQEQHFDSWVTYAPTQLFSSVFAGDAFPGKTLLQVASNGGGGLNALGRHTVAALLNTAASGVSYDLSTQQVIAAFNAAYATRNVNRYEEQKNVFAMLNEQGCPLN